VASTLAALTAAELRGAGHESGARAYGTLQPSRSPSGGQAAAPVPGRATIPASPATAAQLEARGHELLALGQREAAVGVLERAVAATGENLDGCREPVSETCLTYAYALYDLGRALLLDHQPQAAVMILEHRLQIANQRPAVQSELDLARQEAGLQTRPQ
jgi:tetratricopeptide (TPR) repeat protein